MVIMYVQLLVVELGDTDSTYLYFLASVAAGSLLGTLKAIDGAIENVQDRSIPLSKKRPWIQGFLILPLRLQTCNGSTDPLSAEYFLVV